jgi:hypothetical protein
MGYFPSSDDSEKHPIGDFMARFSLSLSSSYPSLNLRNCLVVFIVLVPPHSSNPCFSLTKTIQAPKQKRTLLPDNPTSLSTPATTPGSSSTASTDPFQRVQPAVINSLFGPGPSGADFRSARIETHASRADGAAQSDQDAPQELLSEDDDTIEATIAQAIREKRLREEGLELELEKRYAKRPTRSRRVQKRESGREQALQIHAENTGEEEDSDGKGNSLFVPETKGEKEKADQGYVSSEKNEVEQPRPAKVPRTKKMGTRGIARPLRSRNVNRALTKVSNSEYLAGFDRIGIKLGKNKNADGEDLAKKKLKRQLVLALWSLV